MYTKINQQNSYENDKVRIQYNTLSDYISRALSQNYVISPRFVYRWIVWTQCKVQKSTFEHLELFLKYIAFSQYWFK